jgi:hypothetical protein
MGPCRRKFMNCRAMEFIMMVLRISFTLKRALRKAGDEAPEGSGHKACGHAGRYEQIARKVREAKGNPGASHGAQDDLAFAADVYYARAEGYAYA